MQAEQEKLESEYAWLQGRQQLTSLIVRFNSTLASSIHADRAAQWVNSTLIEKSQASKRTKRRLSDALRQWSHLAEQGYYEFQPLCRRFALLEYPTMHRLANLTGAALLSRQLSRIVLTKERQTVRASLGNETFDFAVKEAYLIAGDQAFSDSLPSITLDAVEQVGWAQLEQCLSDERPALIRGLELKLPSSLKLNFQRKVNPSVKQRVAHLLRKVLIAKVKPELAPCFQS